jgi:pimeloyl-ACP methyl ester carboxylesterase
MMCRRNKGALIMEPSKSGFLIADADVSRRFVEVEGKAVHYRVAGNGPAVVMLHDSPRSSRLHLETIRHLSRRFRVFALDTPGYGNSQPLDMRRPDISDFAHALGAALDALGLNKAPLYATHTSAKIALEYAASNPLPPRLILDGLSIPAASADPAFIDRYMRPFRIEETGGYLATEWTRMRDMVRWFPWFEQRPDRRIPVALPDEAWTCDYVIDFFSAGPNYASAYGAAMRYDPMPALRSVQCPTVVAAKSDDVLFAYLDNVPVGENPRLSVEPLSAGREAWLAWLEDAFASGTGDMEPLRGVASQPLHGWLYVDLAHGPLRLHRAGPADERPLLILSAPTTLHALRWQAALSDHATLVPELPGFGESASLSDPSVAAMADALAAMTEALGLRQVDLIATTFATPLGAAFAARHPDLVGRVILDGCFHLADGERGDFAAALCPTFAFDTAGGHIHRYWHMLRDAEASWPWYAVEADARRALAPLLDAGDLHGALVGLLKQTSHYGDVARIACNLDRQQRYPLFGQPALLLNRPDDPGYGETEALAAKLPDATLIERSATIDEAARSVASFLARVPASSDAEVAL